MGEGDIMKTRLFPEGLVLLAVVAVGAVAVPAAVAAEAPAGRVEEGKKLFARHCAGCHGAEGKGDGYKLLGADPANLASTATKKKSDAALLRTIHEGRSTMPAWKVRLSERDSRDVLTYIRSLSK
jgi:mono/diheme cytochrome c family protein